MTSPTNPPPSAIAAAEQIGRQSPCAKSKRGVVIYYDQPDDTIMVVSEGFNGMPAGFHCSGSEECRANCAKRCVHAEQRAIRAMPMSLGIGIVHGINGPLHYRRQASYLLHVELGEDGKVIPGKTPCCWQCSREILDCNRIAGVWLYEITGQNYDLSVAGRWKLYTTYEFHKATLAACDLADWGQR